MQTEQVLDLQMKTVKSGGQVLRHNPQEVAGHGDDIQVVRTIEHMIRKPCISQLVVMEIHGPVKGHCHV